MGSVLKLTNTIGVGGSASSISLCSYYFDRVNKYINMGNSLDGIINGANKTFSVRAVFRRTTTSNGMALFSQWLTTGNQRGFQIQIQSTGEIKVLFSSTGSALTGFWLSTGTILDANWHHLVVRYVNGVVTVRLDGVDYTGTSTTIPTTIFLSTESLLYGSQNGGTSGFLEGYLNQVNVTSDFITNTEDVALYNGGSPRLATDLLDNISMNTIFDNDTWDGSNWAVINTVGANGTTVNMIAVDKDCNENPY